GSPLEHSAMHTSLSTHRRRRAFTPFTSVLSTLRPQRARPANDVMSRKGRHDSKRSSKKRAAGASERCAYTRGAMTTAVRRLTKARAARAVKTRRGVSEYGGPSRLRYDYCHAYRYWLTFRESQGRPPACARLLGRLRCLAMTRPTGLITVGGLVAVLGACTTR